MATKTIEFRDELYSVIQFSKEFGIAKGTIYFCLEKKWTGEEIYREYCEDCPNELKTFRRREENKILHELNGIRYTANELCSKFRINKSTFYNCINRGEQLKDIIEKHSRNKKQTPVKTYKTLENGIKVPVFDE